MPLKLELVEYAQLNTRAKENYNYASLSALLALYGYTTLRLHDDWQGADFIAYKADDEKEFVKVQLKGRLTVGKKYRRKNIYIAFREKEDWYLIPHDKVLSSLLRSSGTVKGTASWEKRGGYSFPYLKPERKKKLAKYLIPAPPIAIVEAASK